MASSVGLEHHKVIVLGAGFNGVAVAKTYLDIDPSVDILLVDRESSVGGVWSTERIYPGLYYEMPAPLMSFNDMDICQELGIEKWSDVTAYQINTFLVPPLHESSAHERADKGRSGMPKRSTLSDTADSTPWLRRSRGLAPAGRFSFNQPAIERRLSNP